MTDVDGRSHQRGISPRIPTSTPQVKAGKVRALAVGAAKRQAALPDVPTADEAGLPGYHVSNWVGLVAPAGAPPAIVDKLNKEITAIMQSPEMQKQLENQGLEFTVHDPGRVRHVHGEGIGQMGTRREGGRHYSAMTSTRGRL